MVLGPHAGMAQWRAHTNFVSAVVSEGFTAVAVASVGQLVKSLEASEWFCLRRLH